MTSHPRTAGGLVGRPVSFAALFALFALMLPMSAEAGAAVIKGLGNAGDALGDIGKQLDINPGVFPDVPVTAPTFKGTTPTIKVPGPVWTPGAGWASPGQIGNKLPPTVGPAPVPPPRTVVPPPGADDALPPIKYTGVGPENVPVRKITPEVSTGLGVRHEPNPLGVSVPVKVNPPVKLPNSPVASTTPLRVDLPSTPVAKTNPLSPNPGGASGALPPIFVKLYGSEDAALAALRPLKPSLLKRVAKVGGIALGTVVVLGVVGGGAYVAAECYDKQPDACAKRLRQQLGIEEPKDDPPPTVTAAVANPPTVTITVENQSGSQATVNLVGGDGTESALTSLAPGQTSQLQVAQNASLNVYKDGVFLQSYGVGTEDWTIPIR